VQQEFNIVYLQIVKSDFIHFILMHHRSYQSHIHVKINSQEYLNPIPKAFKLMITHKVSIL